MRTKVSDVCQRIFSEVDTDCKFLSVFWSRSALPLIQQGTIKHSRSTIKHFVVDIQQFCQAIYDDALKAIIFFCTIIFLYKLFFWTNIFSARMFFCTNIFLYEYFSVRIFFCTNIFLCECFSVRSLETIAKPLRVELSLIAFSLSPTDRLFHNNSGDAKFWRNYSRFLLQWSSSSSHNSCTKKSKRYISCSHMPICKRVLLEPQSSVHI